MKQITVIIYFIISTAFSADVDHANYNITTDVGATWTVKGDFDLTHGDPCPSPWFKITVDGRKMCRVPSDTSGCSSVKFPTFGIEYSMIRGKIRGYQKGTTDGFQASHEDGVGIDGPYVDGVSITLGYPRQHVWTYAVGVSADGNDPYSNCPCAATRGPNPPAFVGKNYYCQSGSQRVPDHGTYFEQPLWQGNCTYSNNNCCAKTEIPWFGLKFPSPQYDDIEVRICYNEEYSNEAVLIDQLRLEIYRTG